MTLPHLSSRQAVIRAIEEYDRMGRDRFLKHYGFARARAYLVRWKGRLYDSKAIAGVAHGIEFPDLGPLRSSEFEGGRETVQAKLEALGFVVEVHKPRIAQE